MTTPHFLQRLALSFTVLIASVAWSAPLVPPPPEIAAKSYVLMDAASGDVLAQHDGDTRLPPASLTKMMTAYIATLEMQRGRIHPGDMVTISEKAWRTGGSKMFVEVGKQVSVDDLFHGIIIQSGNDASIAMAEHIAGSEDAFVSLMNAEAQRLGMRNTHFTDATGLPHPDHYSSAHDMAILARAIINADPAHYAIYKQKYFLWNGINQPNRNLLLWRDDAVDGLKTGHTEEAGYCLVASAKRGNERLIAAVFGTDSEAARAAETAKLLTYGFRFFDSRTFYNKGAVVTDVPVWKGAARSVKAGVNDVVAVSVAAGEADKLVALAIPKPTLIAPVKQGDVIGKVEIRAGDKVIKQVDLVATESVEQGGFFRRIWDSIRLFFRGLFG
ncbi:D-alanyl-D-alanine carboxypeptidase family protein [Thiobacillus sedimenti]|uniref:serine-type D-Ala-D-Ala carboxypeptidase n=1 Tax=Thiobacillus sedimenti TaxID=3110231 RepID=A0ABZ1CL74_9PROT|nr:D-alanyl-D-alanine carboxypeptidase family protein [Thiobacillus sp. SCUT-2]WRS39964.1 D-alanyl-D-alanine carboxypeptidase family protein [Thiobacillus sp. SCUT-2]